MLRSVVEMNSQGPRFTDDMRAGRNQSTFRNNKAASCSALASGSTSVADDHCGAAGEFGNLLYGLRLALWSSGLLILVIWGLKEDFTTGRGNPLGAEEDGRRKPEKKRKRSGHP